MNNLISLVKRNIKIFYRTKGNIFFSLLAVLILVALHFAIFRNMYTDNWVDITSQITGLTIEREALAWLVDNLMLGAIIPIGAVTISLTTLGLMVADKEQDVLSDFLVSPIKRNTLLTSYLLSSFIISFSILTLFTICFQFYFVATYGINLSILQFGFIMIAIIGSLAFANIFILLIISYFKKQQTLTSFGTIIGTALGFLSGAYIPIGMFGETIGNIFSALPFFQLTVLTRQAFLYELENFTPLTQEMLTGEIARSFGMEIWIGDTFISTRGAILISGSITLILFVALIVRFSKMKKVD